VEEVFYTKLNVDESSSASENQITQESVPETNQY